MFCCLLLFVHLKLIPGIFWVFLTGHRDLFFLILISNILVGLRLINGLRESGKITEMNIPSCKHSALDVVTVRGGSRVSVYPGLSPETSIPVRINFK